MYVIAVYDVSVERVDTVRKFLKQYMVWKQNSVFEGELTKVEFERVKLGVEELIEEEDYVIFYTLRDERLLKRVEIGTPRVDTSNII